MKKRFVLILISVCICIMAVLQLAISNPINNGIVIKPPSSNSMSSVREMYRKPHKPKTIWMDILEWAVSHNDYDIRNIEIVDQSMVLVYYVDLKNKRKMDGVTIKLPDGSRQQAYSSYTLVTCFRKTAE